MKIEHRDFKKNPLTEAEIEKLGRDGSKDMRKYLAYLKRIFAATKKRQKIDDGVRY